MGTWGTGLYSDDFALDLRSTIASLSRLPLSGEQIVEIASKTESSARDSEDSDHVMFWLVVADQLQKRGIVCPDATAKALSLIESGLDSANLAELGMKPSDLRKRETKIGKLRERLLAGTKPKDRATLKRPQSFVLNVGDVIAYPTSRGEPINPYSRDKSAIPGWSQDGWGAMVIVDRGLAYEYLAWYAPLVVFEEFAHRPTLQEVLEYPRWLASPPGTCTSTHFRRMELQCIGSLNLCVDALDALRPLPSYALHAAASDISISNTMGVLSKKLQPRHLYESYARRTHQIEYLQEILTPY